MKNLYKNILTILFTLFSVCACCEQNILNIYAWGNYIPGEIIAQFTKETGIKVNLAEYDNNETMFAKLQASGRSAEYDLVVPSTYYVERMNKCKMLQPIDKTKLSNLIHLNKLLLNQPFDPHNKYSIPYLWGSVGIIINTEYIAKNSLTKWQDFWNKQYKNQLMILDDMRDVFSMI
jgi:spermidine/putrescine transport system substrate-binding protein